MTIADPKRRLLNDIVDDLKKVKNMAAIVLGGSHASGQAHPTSDLDIGIYYFNDKPFDLDEIKTIAKKYSGENEEPVVTGFYEWGPWVNGGAWIANEISDIDFIYREIEHVKSTIQKAHDGIWENHFEQQPPYGFSSITYLAETEACVALYDPLSVIIELKKSVKTYPSKLKHSVLQQSLWATEFTIMNAEGFGKRDDIYNTAGCLTRGVKYLVTALFAVNEMYPLTDKKALEILEGSQYCPGNLKSRVGEILSIKTGLLEHNVALLKALFLEIREFAKDVYTPYYNL